MKLSHKFCNRLKSNKGLKKIQKTLGIKSKTKRKQKRKKVKRKTSQIRFNMPKLDFWKVKV